MVIRRPTTAKKSSNDKDGRQVIRKRQGVAKGKDNQKSSENGEKATKDGQKSEKSEKNEPGEKQERSKDSARKRGKAERKLTPTRPQTSLPTNKRPTNRTMPRRKPADSSGTAKVKPPEKSQAKPREGAQARQCAASTDSCRTLRFPLAAWFAAAVEVDSLRRCWPCCWPMLSGRTASHCWPRYATSGSRWPTSGIACSAGKPGRRRKSSRKKRARQPMWRRFADFSDPFAAGTAGRYPPEELVRYTFEALEAWARDNGQPRLPEQTPA